MKRTAFIVRLSLNSPATSLSAHLKFARGVYLHSRPLASRTMADASEPANAGGDTPVLDGTSAAGADGSAPVLGADGQPISKSALKKLAKLKELEAKKASAAAVAEARAKATPAAASGEEGAAAKKASYLLACSVAPSAGVPRGSAITISIADVPVSAAWRYT